METQVILGKISVEESSKLQRIFQRKLALLEILPTIKAPMDKETLDYLYEKAVADLQQTNQRMKEWWAEVSKIHGWEYGEGYSWSVNFNEQIVTIIKTPGVNLP